MLTMEAVMLFVFIALEYHFPDIIMQCGVKPHGRYHYADLAFGATMSFIVNFVF